MKVSALLILGLLNLFVGCNDKSTEPGEESKYLGSYDGSFDRADGSGGGTWMADVTGDGSITGSGRDTAFVAGQIYNFSINGTVESNGTAAFGATIDGGGKTADFTGTFTEDGNFSGTWTSAMSPDYGTIIGTKQ